MAITEVFIQVTDVPLSLWKHQEARWPQIRIAQSHSGTGHCCGYGEAEPWSTPWPMQAPTSALQCYSRATRDQKEEEERDRSKRGRKRTENNRFQR